MRNKSDCTKWHQDKTEYCSIQGVNFDCNRCPYFEHIEIKNTPYKCIECNFRFFGNEKTVNCPRCNSEDIKEQHQSPIHTHNPYYTNSLFKNN